MNRLSRPRRFCGALVTWSRRSRTLRVSVSPSWAILSAIARFALVYSSFNIASRWRKPLISVTTFSIATSLIWVAPKSRLRDCSAAITAVVTRNEEKELPWTRESNDFPRFSSCWKLSRSWWAQLREVPGEAWSASSSRSIRLFPEFPKLRERREYRSHMLAR